MKWRRWVEPSSASRGNPSNRASGLSPATDPRTGRTRVVEAAARTHGWIRLLRLPPRPGRSFAAVVHNTEAGITALNCRDYQYLGLLDADLEFEAGYFETLLHRFETNPRLGLAGGVVITSAALAIAFHAIFTTSPGPVQLFRRECFESLGGLVAIPRGDGMRLLAPWPG